MQEQISMTDDSSTTKRAALDGKKAVLEVRKRRQRELRDEMRLLARQKKKLKSRLQEGRDWPIDAVTGERADIPFEDVRAPLPEEMRATIGDVDERMQKLRAVADTHEAFVDDVVPVDPGVLSRRRREREEEVAQRDSVRGSTWTEELVEARLEEAYKTLFRAAAGGVGPRAFGNAMPEVVREVSDLVHQAGNKSLRNAIAHRFKGVPSTEEVRRAEDALSWSLTYLRDYDPDFAGFLNLGAMWKAWGAKISHKCQAIGVHRQVFYRDRKEAVKLIVEGLLKDGKAPT
jgi:hypothetical protein